MLFGATTDWRQTTRPWHGQEIVRAKAGGANLPSG